MANNALAVQQVIDDTYRLLILVQQVIANPTQAAVDAVVAAPGGLALLGARPSYSIDGQSFQWESYRRSLIDTLKTLRDALIWEQGPFELRSRART